MLLDTSRSAAINRDRDKFHEILQKTEGEAAEWWQFAAEVSGLMSAHFGDQRSATLIPLVGDSLSLPELQTLMIDLLDGTRGEVRGSLGPILGSKSASEMTGGLARAQLLQLMLFVRDELIGNSLDRLVRSGRIGVPSGEIRRPVIAGGMRSGAFRLRAELGEHGVRFASDDPGFALLRLRRVLDRLYVREAATDVEELEWQLRGIDVEDVDERLDHFFQRSEPRSVLERMVLARKTNMIAACEEVGLEDGGVLPDDELISTLMWKLGFSVTSNKDPHVEFWSRHERLWALAQSSEIGASERFLDSASPYFSRLEGILLDALAFTAWAFLTDHTTAHFPFTYDDEEDRIAGLALMQEIAPSPAGSADYTADRVDLANLVSGFSALGRRLEQCADDPDKYRRPDAELPDYDGKTSIKTFLLRSTVPFIDLTAPSRNRIVAGLREVTRILVNADVASVRNDYSHYRRNSPDVAKVEAALEATRQAVTRIETLGFCRLLFVPNRVTKDSWGRSRHEFVGPRSYEHLFTRPTRFDWMGLPPITEPAYLVRAASIGEPTEVLRFSRRYTSSFSEMWTGYPARRRTARTTSSEQQPVDHDAQVGAHVP
ncbi:hypothetical protein Q760_04000 [Cellulomonas cellasea DSM 20118]|uniref:Uncharacterized protein n=1 Tax=Cellulomonas cellasea DSM 20118 TaxID=1408250 RepID=A0A0A0BC13_9CELL|nr:hypothetical protein Q760_04000 [Cellulomonas cellasea DSM 20118]